MLVGRADFTIEGPGFAMHVHGDGPVLIADVRGGLRNAAHAVGRMPGIFRFARKLSRSLRAADLRLEVRVAGRTFVRLG